MEEKKRLKLKFNAPVTLSFSALCLAATVLGLVTKGFTDYFLGTASLPGILLHVFAHGGGWEHMAGNLMFILLLGPMLEEKYGSKALLGMMVLNAVVTGSVMHFLAPGINLTGASGIVFMMILLSSFTGNTDGIIPVTALLVGGIYLGQEVYDMMFVADNVSQGGHLIGGIVGTILGFSLNRQK